ncbi:MAG: sortase [Candidatus Daviesbacteria bacterium GW2011_GWA1_41_61]|nr:MAG: sortase [Candidatus Daviesbacteria bacterium GW2011_GWC1_40_9]KKR92736.1 MAG: sortase [Candidatus Daviesbacteria bacterium GW2011_GWB1_41_15]KKS14496.1 MAG: sortase [Candidatus Daviesbacteria bacterium GW2011_GWA1_41_61]
MFKSKRFRNIFLIRFAGYFFIQVGLVILALVVEPVINEEMKFRFNELTGRQYILPRIITSTSDQLDGLNRGGESVGFGDLRIGGVETITPVSTDFGIVIEKINANAKVVADVNPAKEAEYMAALRQGVAHAKGTSYPGQKGNIYLFSHSTDAPWNVVRFNAIFYLLGKLETGDRVIIFYQGRRFDYIVFDKIIAKPEETQYLTNVYPESILTLQTCDPPGTTLNRLIIRAKLVGS